eukprot:gb/GECG01001323.1/.p1 GENE.gb/GECG01001323.1/~~gb/GECG01001323.1/.p1  ORF type:complete len:106 (+),score=7.33 gb/GECG01001323.1/:1-318(+)
MCAFRSLWETRYEHKRARGVYNAATHPPPETSVGPLQPVRAPWRQIDRNVSHDAPEMRVSAFAQAALVCLQGGEGNEQQCSSNSQGEPLGDGVSGVPSRGSLKGA